MAEGSVPRMRMLATIFLTLFFSAAGAFVAHADEAEAIEAINKAAAALDQAFETDNTAAKALMTPDHIAVTPYYDGPQSVADQLASLPDFQYEQNLLGDVSIKMLGSDAALRSFSAELNGSFKGRALPRRVFISAVWVKRDGAWAEKFYQVTALSPEAP